MFVNNKPKRPEAAQDIMSSLHQSETHHCKKNKLTRNRNNKERQERVSNSSAKELEFDKEKTLAINCTRTQ